MTDQCYKLMATGAGTSTQVTGAHFSVSSNHHMLGLWERDKGPKMEGEVNPPLYIGLGQPWDQGDREKKWVKHSEERK